MGRGGENGETVARPIYVDPGADGSNIGAGIVAQPAGLRREYTRPRDVGTYVDVSKSQAKDRKERDGYGLLGGNLRAIGLAIGHCHSCGRLRNEITSPSFREEARGYVHSIEGHISDADFSEAWTFLTYCDGGMCDAARSSLTTLYEKRAAPKRERIQEMYDLLRSSLGDLIKMAKDMPFAEKKDVLPRLQVIKEDVKERYDVLAFLDGLDGIVADWKKERKEKEQSVKNDGGEGGEKGVEKSGVGTENGVDVVSVTDGAGPQSGEKTREV